MPHYADVDLKGLLNPHLCSHPAPVPLLPTPDNPCCMQGTAALLATLKQARDATKQSAAEAQVECCEGRVGTMSPAAGTHTDMC